MEAASRLIYDGSMGQQFFTIVCDYRGGTYVSQVEAADHEQALTLWGALLSRQQPIGGASHLIARAVDKPSKEIVPINGLVGVWCWAETVDNVLALVNIIRSARP